MGGSDYGRSIVEYNIVSDVIDSSMASATHGYIQEECAESVMESMRSSSFDLAIHAIMPSSSAASAPASSQRLEDQPGEESVDASAAALQVEVERPSASEVSSVVGVAPGAASGRSSAAQPAGGYPEAASRKSSAAQPAGEQPEAASRKSSAAQPARAASKGSSGVRTPSAVGEGTPREQPPVAKKTSSVVPTLDLQARVGSHRSSAARPQNEELPAGEGLPDERPADAVPVVAGDGAAAAQPSDEQARAASNRSSLAQPHDEGASEAAVLGAELLATSEVSSAVRPPDAQADQQADADTSAVVGETPQAQPVGEQERPASRGSSGARAAPAASEGAPKVQPAEVEPPAASKTPPAVVPLDLSAARAASEGPLAAAARVPAPASREAAMMRTLKTNSGATKQEVASFAQSLTSSIFKNTHKSVAASRARSSAAGSRPPRPDAMPSSSSYSPPPVSSRPSARLRAAADAEAAPADDR